MAKWCMMHELFGGDQVVSNIKGRNQPFTCGRRNLEITPSFGFRKKSFYTSLKKNSQGYEHNGLTRASVSITFL